MALIYQSKVETSADPSAENIVQQGLYEIHETHPISPITAEE